MPRPNPFQTAAHCWRFALRRATADGDTYHVVMTDDPAAPRAVLSERVLFKSESLTPEDIEASCDPFLLGIQRAPRKMTDYSKPVRLAPPAWTDEELCTLVDFRRRSGHRWKSKLLELYLFGTDDSEPTGAGLRPIRNCQGPSRVDALRNATLDEAEKRLASIAG